MSLSFRSGKAARGQPRLEETSAKIFQPRIGDSQQHLPQPSIRTPDAPSIINGGLCASIMFPQEAWMRSSSVASTSSRALSTQPKRDLSASLSRGPVPAAILAESIKACSNWHLLRALLLSIDKRQLNTHHIASALSRTAEAVRLRNRMSHSLGHNSESSQRELEGLSLFLNNTLLPLAARLLPKMGPRELSNSLHSISTLVKPPSLLSGRSIAMVGNLDLWIDSCLLLVGSRRLKSPRDLSSVIWSLGILLPLYQNVRTSDGSRRQSRVLIQEILASSMSTIRSFNAQDLSTTFVGLARLSEHDPNLHLITDLSMPGFLQHTLDLMSSPSINRDATSSQSWSNILHSIDELGVHPGLSWLAEFSRHNQIILADCSGQSLAMLAGSMGQIWTRASHESSFQAVAPDEMAAWSECLMTEVLSRIQSEQSSRSSRWLVLSLEDLTAISLSLSIHAGILISSRKKDRLQLISDVAMGLQDQFVKSTALLKPNELAGSMAAVAKLVRVLMDLDCSVKNLIDPSFLKACSKQALILASAFNQTDVSQLLWALAYLSSSSQLRPSSGWLQSFLTITRPSLADMNGAELSISIWSISELSVGLPKAWMFKLDWQWRLSFFTASSLLFSTDCPCDKRPKIRDLGMMLHAMGRMKLRPIQGWSTTLISSLEDVLETPDQLKLSGRSVALATWGIFRSCTVLPSKAMGLLLNAVLSSQDSMTSEEAALAAWSMSSLWLKSRSLNSSRKPAATKQFHRSSSRPPLSIQTNSYTTTVQPLVFPDLVSTRFSSKDVVLSVQGNQTKRGTLLASPGWESITTDTILVRPTILRLLLPPRPLPTLKMCHVEQAREVLQSVDEMKSQAELLSRCLRHCAIQSVLSHSGPLNPKTLALAVKSLSMAGKWSPKPCGHWIIAILASLSTYSEAIVEAANSNCLRVEHLSTFSSVVSGLRSIQARLQPVPLTAMPQPLLMEPIFQAACLLIPIAQHPVQISTVVLGVTSVSVSAVEDLSYARHSLMANLASASITRLKCLAELRCRVLSIHSNEMERRSNQRRRDQEKTIPTSRQIQAERVQKRSGRKHVRIRLPSALLRPHVNAIRSFVDLMDVELPASDKMWLEDRI